MSKSCHGTRINGFSWIFRSANNNGFIALTIVHLDDNFTLIPSKVGPASVPIGRFPAATRTLSATLTRSVPRFGHWWGLLLL